MLKVLTQFYILHFDLYCHMRVLKSQAPSNNAHKMYMKTITCYESYE